MLRLPTVTMAVDVLSGAGRDGRAAPALIAGDRVVGVDELADLVTARRHQLGRRPRLVLLQGGNDLELVVTYLAARQGHHPVLLSAPDTSDGLIDRYRPDVVASTSSSGIELERRRGGTADEELLHPDLALLLSTSGSTGAPKLVRLSHANLEANASAIAEFQGLDAGDRGITSLPLHYCYGLSVLNAHMAVGASVVLTDNSVVDACFWDAMARHEVSNLAGVPHTFDLIEQIGFDHLALPSLRLITQAGGRMRPEMVRHLAGLGPQLGWDFVVMYGQTEATARMAYLPPDLAATHPDRVGLPVPGGSFEIRPVGDGSAPPGVGAVIYRGPNVMMGYAEQASDLARGTELDELMTGDLGRIDEHGLLEIVGRSSRFAKLFGLRIDLARIEQQLAVRGVAAMCASDDTRLVVAVEPTTDDVRGWVAEIASLPTRAVDVIVFEQLPRLLNGKPDYQAILTRGDEPAAEPEQLDTIDRIYEEVLGVRALTDDDTFASLGGDSFSYVEVSIRIEQILGFVPEAWHVTPLRELRALQPKQRVRWVARVESNVLLRAFAIVAVVCTHMHVARIPAGAHLLLAVVGFNYARVQLPRFAMPDRRRRITEALKPIVRIAAVTVALVGVQMLVFGGYGISTLLLVNDYVGAPQHVDGRWRFWFFEAIVQIMLVFFVLFLFAGVRRFERRHPFLLPLLLLIPAGLLRFQLVELVDRDYNYIYRPDTIVWCFLLGWAAAQTSSWRQRLLVSALAIPFAFDFFRLAGREWRLVTAVVLLAWVATLPVPRILAQPIGWVASASMWIFMTHWLIWPELTPFMPRWLALVGTVAGGVLVWAACRSAGSVLRVLKPEPTLDAQVAVRDRRVGGRHDLDDRVVLDVEREVASDAAVRTHGVGLGLA